MIYIIIWNIEAEVYCGPQVGLGVSVKYRPENSGAQGRVEEGT